jgi:DUF971 family protein
MDRFDLTTVEGRLAVADRVFCYSIEPHRRKHGPTGYTDYDSYRDWLRDEFSFRCVFSLIREKWISRTGNFDIDHLKPRAKRPDLTCEYDNLLYLSHQANLTRNKRCVPDPCAVALGKSLRVVVTGERMGEIEGLNPTGTQIIRVLSLDSEDATRFRRNILKTVRSLAIHDEAAFREWVGYPAELPVLRPPHRRNPDNTRPEGLDESALALRERNELPEWY